MAVKPIDPGLTDPNGPFTIMVYGEYGCGKTHLAGDMLGTLKKAGGEVLYINMAGEDGARTLAPFGLDFSKDAVTVETEGDFLTLCNDWAAKGGLQGLVVDSTQMLEVAIHKEVVRRKNGQDRGAEKFEWNDVKWLYRDRLQSVRRAAKYVMFLGVSQPPNERHPRTGPDLGGELTRSVTGWVDFLGHMTSNATGRKITFAPSAAVATRSRAIHPIPDITIPNGLGGWTVLHNALKKAMTPTTNGGVSK